MTTERGSAGGWPRAEEFLRAAGAGAIPHPGGTLLEHLLRVAGTLAAWGADADVQAAGLCHATYGTDGFDTSLLPVSERGELAAVIGERAEALVHLYGSCDRDSVYPLLGGAGPVVFRDRFTGHEHTPDPADLWAFAEITAANELDVLAHNGELATRYGADLYRLFRRARGLLSAAAWDACTRQLGGYTGQPGSQPEPAAGVEISGLDHLVLTVADVERSIAFYQRVLGMAPVTFGEGRRALAFGTNKINLHQAGREFVPHADRPTPGSADQCLVTVTPQDRVVAHLAACGVPVEDGPVPRTGARGPMTSTYLRDPDGNLVEISTYGDGAAS